MTRSRRAIDALISGTIVYGLMAACSGSRGTMLAGSSTGGPSGSTSAGHAGSTGHGSGGAGHGGAIGSGGAIASGGAGHGGAVASSAATGGGTSSAGGSSGSSLFDALTDPVSEAMAGVENPQSGTRLKGKFLMGADGSKEYQLATLYPTNSAFQLAMPVQAVWYDSLLQEDCTFLPASDANLHCLPGPLAGIPGYGAPVFFLLIFLDSQCKTPIVVQLQPQQGCVAYTTPKYVQYQEPNTCSGIPTTRVFQVGTPAAAPVTTYSAANGICGSSNFNPGTVSVMEYFSATEVPPSAFVQASTGIDP